MWDATQFLAVHTKTKGECKYIGVHRDCRGHYNEEGYSLLAQFVAEKMLAESVTGRRED